MTNKRMAEITRQMVLEVLGGTIILLFLLGLMLCAGYVESHYTMDATVTDIQGADIVTFCDNTDNEWVVYTDGYKVGDKVTLTFFDNNTVTRYDDQVINFKRD